MKKFKISRQLITCILILVMVMASYQIISAEEGTSGISNLLNQSASGINVGSLFIPYDSSEMSATLALQLLGISSGENADDAAAVFETAGLTVLAQINYDKDQYDASHTCAYTIGRGNAFINMRPRTAIVVSIRGTMGGEWFSNFDFSSSRDDTALFADNFLYCAEDVFLTLKDYIDAEENPVVIITGHSRGAACANLLGMLVNEYYDPDDVYVYTYATPETVRSDTPLENCSNIFNFINPCDLIPVLPLKQWGYTHAGTDITLPVADEELYSTVCRYSDTLMQIAPTVYSYYHDRHSLETSGLDEYGLTAFELMLTVSDSLISLTEQIENGDSELSTDDLSIDFSDNGLSEDSDFYPLAEIYDEISADDFALGINILSQHLPAAYMQLLMEIQ